MSTLELRLEALENQIAALRGSEVANGILIRMMAKTLAHTAIKSPDDVAVTINNWKKFLAPLENSELPPDHSENDKTQRNYFDITIRSFFSEMQKAVDALSNVGKPPT